MPETLTVEQHHATLKIYLPKQLEKENALGIFHEVRKAIAAAHDLQEVELHLAGVEEWDSIGLGAIVQLCQDCKARKLAWKVNEAGAHQGFRRAVRQLKDLSCVNINDPRRQQSFITRLGSYTHAMGRDIYNCTVFVGDVVMGLLDLVRRPGKVRWREAFYFMDRTGTEALPITGMITFLMGLILGFQSATQLQKLGGDVYVAHLVAVAITFELGPLMVAMICTGRAGSAFAAEIGTMKVNEEIDALQTMGFDRTRYLIVPRMIGLTVAMPLLTLYGDLLGIFGGLIATTTTLTSVTWTSYISRTIEALSFASVGQGLIKSVVFAIIIAGVGCLRGLQTERSAEDVGRATTSAVVTSIFLIVLFDTALTIIFTRLFPI